MIIRISQLKLRPDHSSGDLEREIRNSLHLDKQKMSFEIMRCSIDARKKPELFFVYTVDVTVDHPARIMKRIKNKNVTLTEKTEYVFPKAGVKMLPPDRLRPVVVGSGPAGLFCALMLSRAGLRPIVLERGEQVEQRVRTVKKFWETGELNPQSNVQFGEGGAGTFSDGKLNTLIKDPTGRIRFVLKEFVAAGADPSILYDYKPHIGTDVLAEVVRNIREEICSRGGEFRFQSCLTGITVHSDSHFTGKAVRKPQCTANSTAEQAAGRYTLSVNHGESELCADDVVLAIGHSARDTFEMLNKLKLPMQPKAFAVGFRVEHPQKMINEAMYGKDCPFSPGAAPYKVTHKCANGRGVYSFCMCPGGYVVNASSEPGQIAVNGMSYSGRDGCNANSAVVVTVTPEDYEAKGPLSGVAFQRRLEQAAYVCGGGCIPVQRFGDFCSGTASAAPGSILPQTKGRYRMTDLRGILPEHLNESIKEGIHAFGMKIPGFDDPDILLSGIESRTSSPVRILRDAATLQSSLPGIYPCGEGAGYAGGITSAAVDGIRIAEAIAASA